MAEEIIKKSEQRYRSLYQAVTGGVIVRDKNGRILEVNNAACKMLGLPEDQIKGRTSKELCPNWPVFREDKSVLPDDEQPAMITLRTGKSVEDYVMVVFNPAKKQYRWILVNSQPMLDSKKDVEAAVTTFIDITDQKKMEEELLNQKNKAESYLNIVGKIILTLDMNGKVTSLNKKACEILGYAQSELKGKDWVDMCIAKENRESTRTFFQELIKGEINSQEHYEGFIITRSGDEKSIVWHSALLKDQTGQISGTLSYGEEVTAHKQMEKALLQSEPFNRVLFETSLYGVLFLTLDGKIFSVNKQACNLLGFSRDKIIQANIFDLIAEEEELKSILKELNIRGKVVTELNYKKGSGETFQYKIEARLFWDTYGNKMISLVMRD
jgi:PAS domain S-box-containing protein